MGNTALFTNTTSNHNTALGYAALYVGTGEKNVAIGSNVLVASTTGYHNVAIGYAAASALTTSHSNVSIGYNAAASQTTGVQNNAVGAYAGDAWTTANYNNAFGYGALSSACGDHNTAFGHGAGISITGGQNTAVGSNAMVNATSVDYNTAVGYMSLNDCTTGNYNTAVGWQAGEDITTGEHNTFIGREVGRYHTTGSLNTAIGNIAYGWSQNPTTGVRNIHIGYATNPAASDTNAELVINTDSNGATGKGSATGFFKGFGSGIYQSNNSASWSTTSDERIKKNIVDNNIGLDAIKQIRVRNFEYRTQDEITDFENPASAVVDTPGTQLGVIAQEIETILPDTVQTCDTGVKSVTPDNITWHLVNAVKELSAKNDALAAEVASLKTQINN